MLHGHKVSQRTNPGPDDPRPVVFRCHISGCSNSRPNGDHWPRGWAYLTPELLVNSYIIGTKEELSVGWIRTHFF